MVKNNINQHDFFINSEVSYQSDNIITAVDIGSDKIICFIAKIDKILDKEKPRIVGFGYSQSKGIRNGAITNINELEKSIRRAVDQAENLAGFEVKNVSVNISDGIWSFHKSNNSNSSFEGKPEEAKGELSK